jgi:hypothetical protein
MPARLAARLLALLALAAAAPARADDAGNPFDAPVLEGRPRVFLRADDRFDGLTVAKLRANFASPDLAGARRKWASRPLGRALLWLVDGRDEDRDAAIASLKRMDPSGGSWSDRGPALVQMAALYDWLRDALDEPIRRAAVAVLERNADDAVVHVTRGQAPFFYSRTPGALAGLCVAGLALHGDSPKADAYLNVFRRFGVGEYFRAYDWLDGAATGATYTLNYTFVDLPAIAAAWWSATGRNPVAWVRREQGGWLDDMVRFTLWYMRPGFAFTHVNDQFRGDWDSQDSFCQGLDLASYVTRDGHGRAWSGRWRGRFGDALYHPAYAHNLIFRDPTIPDAPLADLPHAALFGRESCGYAFFRSGWPAPGEPDTATHVFARVGDPVDVHGAVAAGEFQVFRHAPLADRGGRYGNYDSPADQYHRNAISANVVLFTDPARPDDRGDQHTRAGLKSDHATWQQWLDLRARHGHDVARVLDWSVKPGEARLRADLTGANPRTCRRWEREFVWLADAHLVVLDVVETSRPEVARTWQLHLPDAPTVGDRLLSVANRAPDRPWADDRLRPRPAEGRLFVRTLLPEAYTLTLDRRDGAEAFGPDGRSRGPVGGNRFHREFGRFVAGIDPAAGSDRTVFLHVLTATDAAHDAPPAATHRVVGPGLLEVTVAGAAALLRVPDWAAAPAAR